MPPRSSEAKGPAIAQRRPSPCRKTRSISSIVATPSSTSQNASRASANCNRFQRKPGTSRRTTTGALPSAASVARTRSTTAGAVRSPGMTSTGGIRWGGLR